MTLFALEMGVFSLQHITSSTMVKLVLARRPGDEVEDVAVVLAVALGAGPLSVTTLHHFGVVATILLDSPADLLVTVRAFRFGFPGTQGVALEALQLIVQMLVSFGQPARRDLCRGDS